MYPSWDRYFASVTVLEGGKARTVPTDSAEGRILLQQTRLLGFVEGTSLGRTSARFANDPPSLFNLSTRSVPLSRANKPDGASCLAPAS